MTSSVATAPRQADPEWTFGDRLRKARVRYGATQRDFADELEVKHATYAAWEADRTSCPRESAVAKRIEVLTGVRAVWLLGLDEPASPRPPENGAAGVDGGSTTHRYVARKRHLIAVDALLGATPTAELGPGPLHREADDNECQHDAGGRSPFASGRPSALLSIAATA